MCIEKCDLVCVCVCACLCVCCVFAGGRLTRRKNSLTPSASSIYKNQVWSLELEGTSLFPECGRGTVSPSLRRMELGRDTLSHRQTLEIRGQQVAPHPSDGFSLLPRTRIQGDLLWGREVGSPTLSPAITTYKGNAEALWNARMESGLGAVGRWQAISGACLSCTESPSWKEESSSLQEVLVGSETRGGVEEGRKERMTTLPSAIPTIPGLAAPAPPSTPLNPESPRNYKNVEKAKRKV